VVTELFLGAACGLVFGKIQRAQRRRKPAQMLLSQTIESFCGKVACFDFGEKKRCGGSCFWE